MRAVSSIAKRFSAFGVAVNNATEPSGGGSSATQPKRGSNGKLASVWSNYTPVQRAARIAAMKAGHARRKRALAQGGAAKVTGKGAKPVGPTKPASAARKVATQVAPKHAASAKPAPAAGKSAWASMSPEQRAERIARMRAGRGGGTPAAR